MLAQFVLKACQLLKCVADVGAMFGNVRTENILFKLSIDGQRIEGYKFMSFGPVIEIEDAENINIPDQVEHLPPDMLTHLKIMNRFR